MTIAAGFVHRDGVLLCSDSLMEDDYSKDLGYKILPLEGKWGTGLAAFCGTVDYAISAVEAFDRKLKNKSPSTVMESFRELLRSECSKHVLSHPLHGENSAPEYTLLFAIRPKKEKARLYVTSDTTIHEVKRYRCIGIGETLARYLLRPYLLGNMAEKQVVCLAAYALAGVKRTITGCGGLSTFVSLPHDGGPARDYLGQALPKFVEQIAQEFDRDVDQLFVSMVCDTDAGFEWNVEAFSRKSRYFRKLWDGTIHRKLASRLRLTSFQESDDIGD